MRSGIVWPYLTCILSHIILLNSVVLCHLPTAVHRLINASENPTRTQHSSREGSSKIRLSLYTDFSAIQHWKQSNVIHLVAQLNNLVHDWKFTGFKTDLAFKLVCIYTHISRSSPDFHHFYNCCVYATSRDLWPEHSRRLYGSLLTVPYITHDRGNQRTHHWENP